MELVAALKRGLILVAILFLLSLLGRSGQGWAIGFNHGLFSVIAILTAIFAGAVLTPFLLPWLPGRAFSSKGASLGFLTAVILLAFRWSNGYPQLGFPEGLGWLLLIPAVSAFLAMNFTGASTYTSLSGVKKEMRWALPLEIVAAIVGFGLWIGSNFGA
jgi:acetyl-CoA decarbonylase/synthase complex subunit gamma